MQRSVRLVHVAALAAVGGCFAGTPDYECSTPDDIKCPSGFVCFDDEKKCHQTCDVSRDCSPINEACIDEACVVFSGVCGAPTDCPQGWFCNPSGACQKYPANVNCTNSVTDGDETDSDCGGAFCDPCGSGKACSGATDCSSGVCTGLVCQVPACDDGVRNGAEPGVDCGGGCPAACPDGSNCGAHADCQSLVCVGGFCEVPTCDDLTRNGGEGDVDCGLVCPNLCGDGSTCGGAGDCTSRICTGNVCQVPTCGDSAKNGDETDIDCGGSCPANCADGQGCATGADCTSVVCRDNVCVPPGCNDGVQNGGESAIDCGGATLCLRCSTGKTCNTGTDCVSGSCPAGTCAAPSCTDNVQNGSETDVDCGGSCPSCATGQGCTVDGDCQSRTCLANLCGSALSSAIATGDIHTCAALTSGEVRCWGYGGWGRLGYGNTTNIGDNETPASAGSVDVGGSVTQVAAGFLHTCALLATDGEVRCWGSAARGQLGYGNTSDIGDDEAPALAGSVNVGGAVVQIAAGGYHTCALLTTGEVRCWGDAASGELGYGNTTRIGDNETPASAGSVSVGGSVAQIAMGNYHTCALLTTGAVRCWGSAESGQLGYGNTTNIGDNETPASAGSVNVGGSVSQIVAGGVHTCALLASGEVRCWGSANSGRLGYGNTTNIGDNETPAAAGSVNVGASVSRIAAGGAHTCALLSAGGVRCWGYGLDGCLGYANTNNIGDSATPASAGNVNVGGSVAKIVAGGRHTCALLTTGEVRCWGSSSVGQLGYGNTTNIGDNETPASAGSVVVVQ